MSAEYSRFLKSKEIKAESFGFDAPELSPYLFAFQSDITRWAISKGRAALFEDCGLGKTLQQLEWAHRIVVKTKKDALILAPLAVAEQTANEGKKFGIPVTVCESQNDIRPGINITNYEKLHKFKPRFAAIVLDESSILKAFDGKTRKQITEFAKKIKYRLACTATPSPNDYTELGNHAEFLGVMTMQEMLATFFVHDGGDTSKWRLKRHAAAKYWEWVASWAVMIRKPSDLGYSDKSFNLPPLNIRHIEIASDASPDQLFVEEARTLSERRIARADSIEGRVKACADIVNQSSEQWLVWCDRNAESEALWSSIVGAVEVAGSTYREDRIAAMTSFAAGQLRVLVSKPSICGFGMNFQSCHNVAFVGLSDSYEAFYQAVRRCWRFGQTKPVDCWLIYSEREGAVVRNIERKEKQAQEMAQEMVKHMAKLNKENLQSAKVDSKAIYATDLKATDKWEAHLGDCVEVVSKMPENSVDYIIFSPPFASLYTYSASDRDMGNVKTHGEFGEHYGFLAKELYRVLKQGRLLSFHCMNLPLTKERDGVIGIRDFRGELIRMHQQDGFIFHSEVCIWKDPVTAMQRTKAIGLLYKQLRKDSCMSRQGIPDYLVTMRKPGKNEDPVTKTHDGFPVSVWQRYASPVWMDIDASDTLQRESAREEEDERHICPLQLGVIRRAVELWTNPGETVLSPFGGIGSEGYIAVQMRRKTIIVELKPSYYEQAWRNLARAEKSSEQQGLFHSEPPSCDGSDEWMKNLGAQDQIYEDALERTE